MLHPALQPLIPALRALCHQFGVPQLYVFGSAVTERFDASRSDLDVLAIALPLAQLAQGEALLCFWNALESLCQRRVDLLMPDSLQNPFLKAEIE
ncbi:MAG: nucleotidyltransferase family protein [Janthinobacterium lividum]